MGLFDIFRKKESEDGTYYRHRNGGEPYACHDAMAGENVCEDYNVGGAFRLMIQDVFTITGRGTVVTGRVKYGSVTIGERIVLRRTDGTDREVAVAGIEMFRKMMDTARQGDNVGLLLQGVGRNDVGRGDILEKQ